MKTSLLQQILESPLPWLTLLLAVWTKVEDKYPGVTQRRWNQTRSWIRRQQALSRELRLPKQPWRRRFVLLEEGCWVLWHGFFAVFFFFEGLRLAIWYVQIHAAHQPLPMTKLLVFLAFLIGLLLAGGMFTKWARAGARRLRRAKL